MTDKILRRPDIERITGMTERNVRNLEASGRFPRRFKISARAVGWLESEVQIWLQAKGEATQLAESAEIILPRTRGRPKGLPKPPGSGRRKGVPNRVTRDAREAASKFAPKALAALAKLLQNQDSKIALAAAIELLNRAHGRPQPFIVHPQSRD